MTYVGQQPATTFDSGIQDRFTGLTTNTVTLNHEISAEEDILVVWNNIVQDKNTYSVGGAGNKTVTLGGTLVSGDVVTVYYQNKVLQSVNPTAGSVGIAELNVSDGSSGQALTTNGSGTLSFSTISADADNYFASSGLSTKDLGNGLHIKLSDAGAVSGGLNIDADDFVIEHSGSGGMTILSGTSNTGAINFADSGNANAGLVRYDHANNSMDFFTNGSERMSIDTNGKIGFAVASPAHPFHFLYDQGGDAVMAVENSNNSNPQGIDLQFTAANPDNNSQYAIHFGVSGAGTKFVVYSDGDVQNHDNSYGSTSDERIKNNIADASSQWDDIKALKVRKFKLKDDIREYGADKAKYKIGLVAQEAEAVSPNLINECAAGINDIKSDSTFGTLYEDGDEIPDGKKVGEIKEQKAKVKSLKYSILYMKAIKALQEAQTRIETLETKVTALENK